MTTDNVMKSTKSVQAQLDELRNKHGVRNIKDIPLTIPGKGHWLYGVWCPMFPKTLVVSGKDVIVRDRRGKFQPEY
jgi:hypothetical protein